MRILALIPARGKSRRIPGKNIRPLGGIPLIVWSINAVQGIPEICDILVSTDDATIARIAKEAGAQVPWRRPAALATSRATTVDVCLHALERYEKANGKVNGLLLMQPTSPFRGKRSIRKGVDLFINNQMHTVIGVSPAASHPMWCFRLNGKEMNPFLDRKGLHTRSQDLPPAFVVNGAFYLIAPATLRRTRTFYGRNMLPLVMSRPEESIDIDTEWDWLVAESFLASAQSAHK